MNYAGFDIYAHNKATARFGRHVDARSLVPACVAVGNLMRHPIMRQRQRAGETPREAREASRPDTAAGLGHSQLRRRDLAQSSESEGGHRTDSGEAQPDSRTPGFRHGFFRSCSAS